MAEDPDVRTGRDASLRKGVEDATFPLYEQYVAHELTVRYATSLSLFFFFSHATCVLCGCYFRARFVIAVLELVVFLRFSARKACADVEKRCGAMERSASRHGKSCGFFCCRCCSQVVPGSDARVKFDVCC